MRYFLFSCLAIVFLSSGIPFACQQDHALPERSLLTDRIDSVVKAAFFILQEYPDSALDMCQWARNESERISYMFGRAESHGVMGSIFDEKEQYDKALIEHQKCFKLRKALLTLADSLLFEKRWVSIHHNMAITLRNQGDFSGALVYLQRGLDFLQSKQGEWPPKEVIGSTRYLLHTKGTVYDVWEKPDSAFSSYLESLAGKEPKDLHPYFTQMTQLQLATLSSKLNIQDSLLDRLLRENRETPVFLASLWEAKGQRLIDEGKNMEARDTFYKSLDVRRMLEDTLGMGRNRCNIGICYLNEGNYEEAKAELKLALAYYRSQSLEHRLAEAFTSLGILAHDQGKIEEAFNYCKQGYHYAASNHQLEESALAAAQLVTLYEQTGKVDSALQFQKQFRAYRDTLNARREAAIQLAEAARREAEVQAVELANLKERNRITQISAGVIIAILLALIYFIIRQARQNKEIAEFKIQEQETTQKFEQYRRKGEAIERKRLGTDIHDGLGQVLVTAKNMAHEVVKDGVGLKKEVSDQLLQIEAWLEEARKNLKLITSDMTAQAFDGFGIGGWAMELKKRVEKSSPIAVEVDLYEINQPFVADTELQLILIMTELVNNAQKYSQAQNLSIQLQRDDSNLNMIIDDDGIGFSVDRIKKKNKAGLGLYSIKNRVEEKLGGEVQFDSVEGKGTSVIIDIPHIFLLNE